MQWSLVHGNNQEPFCSAVTDECVDPAPFNAVSSSHLPFSLRQNGPSQLMVTSFDLPVDWPSAAAFRMPLASIERNMHVVMSAISTADVSVPHRGVSVQ